MNRASSASVPASGTRPSRARAGLLLGGVIVCAGYLAAELWALSGHLGWPLDDSWIHLQFARNLAAGRGLSYNPGDLVTGSTAPLWTALLALLAYLPGNPLAWAQVAGGVLYLAGLDATWRLARALGLSPGLAALAGFLTLGSGWLAWSALSGMEVPLFVVLSLWGLLLQLRERSPEGGDGVPLAPAVLALAALARPEGLLLLALSMLDRLLVFERQPAVGGTVRSAASLDSADAADTEEVDALRWRRPDLRRWVVSGLLAACVLVGPLLFYRLAGGSFLPTTYAAKGGELRRWLPSLQYVYSVLGIFLRSQPWMTLLSGAGVAVLVGRLGSRRDRGLLPGLWLVGLPLVYSTMSPEGAKMLAGNFGRYYFPLFPLVAVLGTLGLAGAAEFLAAWSRAGAAQRQTARLVTGALVALLLWPTMVDLVQRSGFYAHNLLDVEASDVRAARWLAPRLPADAVLAVNDIGAFKYLLPNRVVDLAGIANPELRLEVRRQVAAGVAWDQAMADAVARRKPDFVAIFPAWLPRLADQLALRPLLRLHVAGNITMGGEDLVVYSTPWTRQPLRRLPGDPG